jgi:hypothetical protein
VAVAKDALVLVAISVVVSLWSREAIVVMRSAASTGVFRAWQDFFLHAAEIVYLRDYSTFGGHSLYLAGSPQPLYHRASYAMPSLFSWLSGVPALETATIFWMPLGLTLCGFALYGLGAAIGGRVAGMMAFAAVFLTPDASTYGLQNTFFSFHWLVQIAPGSGFAIALVTVAFALFISNGDRSGPGALAWCVALAVAAACFRVHVAVLGAAALLALVLTVTLPLVRHRSSALALGAFGLAVAVVGLWLMERISLAPHFLSASRAPMAFFDLVLGQAPDHGALYSKLTDGHGLLWRAIVAYLLMLVTFLGVMAPIAGLLPLMTRGSRARWRVASIPIALMLFQLGIIIVMPIPTYDTKDDFGHRSFVLTYALTAAIIGATATNRFLEGTAGRRRILRTIVVVAVAAAGVAVPVRLGRGIQQRWGGGLFATIAMPSDAIRIARRVRAQSMRGDVVQTSSADPVAMFVALCERQAFVSRPALYASTQGGAGDLARSRLQVLSALNGISSLDQLREFGRANQIAWYLLERPDLAVWPAGFKDRCDSCGPSVLAFDLRDSSPGQD